MAVGKGSIQRAAKAAETTVIAAPAKELAEAITEKEAVKKTPAKKAPAKKPAARKAPAKKAAPKKEEKEVKTVGIGTELPTYLL